MLPLCLERSQPEERRIAGASVTRELTQLPV